MTHRGRGGGGPSTEEHNCSSVRVGDIGEKGRTQGGKGGNAKEEQRGGGLKRLEAPQNRGRAMRAKTRGKHAPNKETCKTILE